MLLAAVLAATAWTAPVPVTVPDRAVASGAFGGSAVGGTFGPTASVAKRAGGGLGPVVALTGEDAREQVRAVALSEAGEAIVLTVRRHPPTQRIRATIVAPDGTRGAARTISDASHSATDPELAVAADGTAVAAWAWHDRAGWRVQAAIRRPGQPRFERPQTLSPPVSRLSRWLWFSAAAGEGGNVAFTWFYGGAEGLAVRPLHVLSAGPDGRFEDQVLPGRNGFYDVGLAVGPGGAVQLAYSGSGFGLSRSKAVLRASAGSAGRRLPAPAVLARGGRGVNSGRAVAAAFPAEGGPLVAWVNPGDRNEAGGALEVFADGSRQVLGDAASRLSLAAGPGRSAVLGWQRGEEVRVATRPQAGGPFGAAVRLAEGGSPTVAMTPAGEALALWGGAVAFHPPD